MKILEKIGKINFSCKNSKMDEFNENGTKTIFGIGNPLLDIQAKESGFIFD